MESIQKYENRHVKTCMAMMPSNMEEVCHDSLVSQCVGVLQKVKVNGFSKLRSLTSRITFSRLLMNVKSASYIEMFNQLADCCQ